MRLILELVPLHSFQKNLRAILSQTQWDILRKQIYSEAYNACEVCDTNNVALHCHEVWSYDDQTHTQKLERMMALCPPCHLAKHMGYAMTTGKYEDALHHLMKVNDIPEKEAKEYVHHEFQVWSQRSHFHWALDVSLLKNFGIEIEKLTLPHS